MTGVHRACTRRAYIAALIPLLLLAGCGAQAIAPVNPPRAGATFVPDSGGLAVAGTGQRIDFGRSPRGVTPVMDRELGRGRDLPLVGCPAGVTRQIGWGDLVLSFTAERFVGWRNATGAAGQTCAVTS